VSGIPFLLLWCPYTYKQNIWTCLSNLRNDAFDLLPEN
jgi:hypothetical protein